MDTLTDNGAQYNLGGGKMDDYTRQKLLRLLRIISPEELQHRALLAKNDDERRIWHELYALKLQQRIVRQ